MLSLSTHTNITQIEFFSYIIRELAIGMTKLSVLFFYRRVFCSRVFSLINWIVITLVALWTVAFTLSDVFLCRARIDLNWALPATSQAAQEKHICGNGKTQAIPKAVSDVALDLAIIAIPIPIVGLFPYSA